MAELRAQRDRLAAAYDASYRELAFRVDRTDGVTARWSYTFTEPGTGDVEPFVSVVLTEGNRLEVVGRLEGHVTHALPVLGSQAHVAKDLVHGLHHVLAAVELARRREVEIDPRLRDLVRARGKFLAVTGQTDRTLTLAISRCRDEATSIVTHGTHLRVDEIPDARTSSRERCHE